MAGLGAGVGRVCCVLLALLLGADESSCQVPSCHQVRSSFQSLQPSLRWAPREPVSGSDLQVCVPNGPTCCTRKMEERYQLAARQNMGHALRESSTDLKFLIFQNAAVFQEAFEIVIRQAKNYTNQMFKNVYRNMPTETANLVGELFADASLYVLGSEMNIDDIVNEFFDNLFPVVYSHVINPGFPRLSVETRECLRIARNDVKAFGNFPKIIMTYMSKSLLAARVFLQALNLGIEVINTTDHSKFSKDCGRALLKMWYCSHCQGLLKVKPCLGYCLNVIHGCMANMVEIHHHWREYIRSLEELASGMYGAYDMENVLLRLHLLIKDAVSVAQRNRARLFSIGKVCGYTLKRNTRSAYYPEDLYIDQKVVKVSYAEHEDTFSSRRKEFIINLRLYSNFYIGLPDQICRSDLTHHNNSECWNGQQIVPRYSHQVVGFGVKAQASNPEVKVKGSEPVISQIIDKLKHINQLLQGKSKERYHYGDKMKHILNDINEDAWQSGDCDDEDDCGGSGQETFEVKKGFRCFTGCMDGTFVDDVTLHKQLLNPRSKDRVSAMSESKNATGSSTPRCLITTISVSMAAIVFIFQ